MRIKLLLFALTLGFGGYAKEKKRAEKELEKVAAGIKEEAMLLFRLERTYLCRLSTVAKVYHGRMNALKKLSGKTPPRPIKREPDSLIVNFYTDWAKSEGYLP